LFIQYFFFGVTEFQVAADDISLQNIIIKSPKKCKSKTPEAQYHPLTQLHYGDKDR
jgi:hypothetical protein